MKKSCLLLSMLSMLSAFTLQASDTSAQTEKSKNASPGIFTTAKGSESLGDRKTTTGEVSRGAIMNALMNIDALVKAKAAVAAFDGKGIDFSTYQAIMDNAFNAKDPKKALAAINGFKDTLSYLYDHASNANVKEQIYNELYNLANVAAQHSYLTAGEIQALAIWKHHKKKIIGAGAAAGVAAAGAAAYKKGLLPSLESFKKDTSGRMEEPVGTRTVEEFKQKPSLDEYLLTQNLSDLTKAELKEQARTARALDIQNAEFANLLTPPASSTQKPSTLQKYWDDYMDYVQQRQKEDDKKNSSR